MRKVSSTFLIVLVVSISVILLAAALAPSALLAFHYILVSVMPPVMFFLFILVWIFGACVIAFKSPSRSRPRRFLQILFAAFLGYGGVVCSLSFLVQLLVVRLLGPQGLFPPSFEWPVAYSSMVTRDSAGHYIVLHKPTSRFQIYDQDKRFLRGWFVNIFVKNFKIHITKENNIEFFSHPGDSWFVFSPEGKILREGTFRPQSFESLPASPLAAEVFPTSWILWPVANPTIGWALTMFGLLGLGALMKLEKRKKFPKKIRKPPIFFPLLPALLLTIDHLVLVGS